MKKTLTPEMAAAFRDALIGSVAETPINTFPFPYLYGRIRSTSMSEVFSSMRDCFPVSTEPDPKAPTDTPETFRSLVHLPDISDRELATIWDGVFNDGFSQSFSTLLVNKFITFIPRYNRLQIMRKAVANLSSDLRSRFSSLTAQEKSTLMGMRKECDWMFTCDRGGYALLPHTDHPRKMITFLLYLTEAGTGHSPPGTSIYAPLSFKTRAWDSNRIQRSDFAEIVRATHLEGNFIAFVKSDISWHGVEPGTHSEKTRMTINLTVQRP